MVRVRPLDVDDLATLEAVDAANAAWSGVDPVATRAAVSFYERTGHAFVAEDASGLRGFVFAQAVWDGVRPTVRVQHLAVLAQADHEVRAALLEVVTKSAYDAAVYDLVVEVPRDDDAADALLRAEGWSRLPTRGYRRTLGSRGTA